MCIDDQPYTRVSRRLRAWLRASGVVLLLAASSLSSLASQSVTLAWDTTSDRRVVGYLVHCGLAHRNYSRVVDVGNTNIATISGLEYGRTYYFSVTAYTSNRVESKFSNEASSFTKWPRSRLTVITNNFGTVFPDLNGSNLVVGRTYELRAAPMAGKEFAGWSGDVTTSTRRLTFVMQSNMVLRAHFAPHSFAGSYSGLFYERDAVRHASSGFFAANVSISGSFSATLWLGGTHYDLSGALDLQGQTQVLVPRAGVSPLTLNLRLDRLGDADQLTGGLSDGSWEAELLADRAIVDATPDFDVYRGRYTLALSPSGNAEPGPPGSGFGAVTVSRKGKVSLVGELADGQTISQTVPLSRRGLWPFYASLYGGKGSILGWLAFTNQATTDLVGLLSWFRPARADARYYPLGFTNHCAVSGSGYEPGRSWDWTNAVLVLGGGNLSGAFTNVMTPVGPKLVSLSGDRRLVCAIDPSTGVFRGAFVDPGTGITNRLQGVVLPKQDRGVGYLRGTNQTGWLRLEPAHRDPAF